MARPIMIQGTMSNVGKSILAGGLCRVLRQDGVKAAPFKSQNMALNSYITRDGLEMGRAQVMQAEAAGIEPDVCMNPILLKPTNDTGSQVIVNGRPEGVMSAVEYYRRKKEFVPAVMEAYARLASRYDVIVIEGAGSPAEINLKQDDIVNMGMAEMADAPVLLAGDIDRGGVFAQLYGTVALLEPEERARIKGLVINKFRGDVEILRPGLAPLEAKTGIPVVGVVPYVRTAIDDEDSLAPGLEQTRAHKPLDIAVIRLPRISNFTDFAPLEQSGLEAALLKRAAAGTPVLGVCGGYQMLGRTLSDPEGTEGGVPGAEVRGLGLLAQHPVIRLEPGLALDRHLGAEGRTEALLLGALHEDDEQQQSRVDEEEGKGDVDEDVEEHGGYCSGWFGVCKAFRR